MTGLVIAFFAVSITLASFALVVVVINVILLLIIRVPYVNTPPAYLKKIIAELEIKTGAVVYDLGCGSGDFLRLALRFEPKSCIGIELSPWAYFIATLKNWRYRKIIIKLKDFFKEDLRAADLVYVYLVPGLLQKVADKLRKELKTGAQVIAVGSALPGWTAQKTIILIEKLNYNAYLYQV